MQTEIVLPPMSGYTRIIVGLEPDPSVGKGKQGLVLRVDSLADVLVENGFTLFKFDRTKTTSRHKFIFDSTKEAHERQLGFQDLFRKLTQERRWLIVIMSDMSPSTLSIECYARE